jgi:hypothetical protein
VQNVAAHAPAPSTSYGRKIRNGNFEAPAMNGAIARTKPMKRPIRMVTPPRRAKKSSTWRRRSSVIFTRGPCRTSHARPSRRPSA